MKRMIYIGVLFPVFLLMLCGCRSVKYVPVETVRTDSVYLTVHERDSIHMHDSIHVREKGDTVFVDRWHTIYKDKVRTDTMSVIRTDSVRVPYPVEKELTRWQKAKIEAGGFAIAAIAVLILIVFGKIVYNIKKGG